MRDASRQEGRQHAEESVSLIVEEISEDSLSHKTTPTRTNDRSTPSNSFLVRNRFWITIFLVILLLILLGQRGFIYVLKAFFGWVKSIGYWGNVMFVLMFFAVSFPVILGGYIPLTMGAGSLYGVVIGTLTVSIGSTLGGIIAFFVCKRFTQNCVTNSGLKQTSQFQLFTMMLKMSDNALFVTLLARLAPIPFGLQNIFFVLAEVPFNHFFIVTWLGLLPLQLLYTYFGATLRNLSEIASGEVELDHMQKLSLLLQVVVIIGLIAYFVYLSRKMKRIQEEKQRTQREADQSDARNNIALQTIAQPDV